jgi:hypothetical protein
MAKKFKDLIQELYEPKSADEKRFVAKHVVQKYKLSKPTEDDDLFNADNVNKDKTKNSDRENERGKDAKVYESVTNPLPNVNPRTDSQRNRSLFSRVRQVNREKYARHAFKTEEVELEEASNNRLQDTHTVEVRATYNKRKDAHSMEDKGTDVKFRVPYKPKNADTKSGDLPSSKSMLNYIQGHDNHKKMTDQGHILTKYGAKISSIKAIPGMVKEDINDEIDIEIDVIAEAEHEAVSKLRQKHERIEKTAMNSGVSDARLKQIKDKNEKERKELNQSIEDNLEAQSRYTKMSHEEVETEEDYFEEGRMPASVIKHKTDIGNLSDKEFADKYSREKYSDDQLRSMAWRHGLGGPGTPGHEKYVNRRKRGLSEDIDLDEAMGTIANQKKAAKFKDSDVNRMIRDEKARKAAEERKEKQSEKKEKVEEALGKRYKSPWDKIEKAKPGIGKRIDTAVADLKQNADDYQKILDKEKKEKVEEALGKSASASDFIHDFVRSKNPKFAGKSKKQRIQQALAAYYQKNEEERSPEFDHAIMEDEIPKPTSPGEAERMAQRYYNMSKTVGDPQSKKHYKYISNKMYALAKQLRKKAVMGEAAIDDTQKATTQITVHDSHEDAKKEALRKSKTYNDIFKVLKDPVTNTYVVTHKDNVDPTGAKPTVGMSHPFDIYTKGNNESFELFADSMINEEITLADGTVANLDGDLTVKLMRLYNGLNENNQDELVYSLHDDIDSLANILDLVNSVE